jgi:diguanylate cyclase (GGDEF)-like protein
MSDRKRIMIVDDNQAIHDDFERILKPQSVELKNDINSLKELEDILFNADTPAKEEKSNSLLDLLDIDHAFNGQQAIEMVGIAEAENYPYALIFMDVRMPPGIDGISTIEKIWGLYPKIEMVLCTAYSDHTFDEIIHKLGTTDKLLFIKKPFDGIAIKQITISLTTKWHIERENQQYSKNLEKKVHQKTKELYDLVEKLRMEIDLKKEKERELNYIASSDTLTGILNRYTFYRTIENLVVESENNENLSPFSILYIDLDNFKEVNDAYGHETGDGLLVGATKRIRDVLNRLSTTECDLRIGTPKFDKHTLFRVGGDEFIAMLYGAKKAQSDQIAKEIVTDLHKATFEIKGNSISTGTSIGISSYPDDSRDVRQLVKFADIAMYQAKMNKNSYMFFSDIENKDIYAYLLQDELQKSLINEEIQMHYQGLMDSDGKLIGLEALVRWYHPSRGMILPAEFIPVAERTGQMIKIGEHILRTACIHLKELHRQGFSNLFVLVNCTTRQFYNSNFLSVIDNAITMAEIDPKFLKIALDERFSIEHFDKMVQIFEELNQKGIQVSIDSFGHGKSLINFLQNIPNNTIVKIDRSYVRNIVNNRQDREFLYHIIEMVQTRNLQAIVSGIENVAQKDLLHSKECIYQGFFFNRPKSFDQLLSDFKSVKDGE